MDIKAFLTLDRVFLNVRVRDKGQLIATIARNFAGSVASIGAGAVEAALLAREQLGSTGLGSGFALPHARIEGLDKYLGMFVRLAKPIEFEAIDNNPVTLVFALLTPAEGDRAHVSALATISRRFRDGALVAQLRQVRSSADAYELLDRGS